MSDVNGGRRPSLAEELERTDPGGAAAAGAAVRAVALMNKAAAGRDLDELAATLGVSRERLDEVLEGDGNVRVSTLARVLRASGSRLLLLAVPASVPAATSSSAAPEESAALRARLLAKRAASGVQGDPAAAFVFGDAINGPCLEGPHRGPQGPNEDLSQCPRCLAPSWSMRPPGETIGLHADDCSLPERHESFCVGGGTGHPPAQNVRGFWPGMQDDIAAARARHAHQEDTPA